MVRTRSKLRLGSVEDVAQKKVGVLRLPISYGSGVRGVTQSFIPNASGVSGWFLLECGVRVCVKYKDWTPFLWMGSPITSKGGAEVYPVEGHDKTNNPNLIHDPTKVGNVYAVRNRNK